MRRNVRGRGEVFIVLGMTGVIILFLSFIALKLYFKHSGIRPGVTFLGYDLSGLKTNDAATKISQIIDYVYADPVYLKFQKYLWMLRYNRHFKLQVDATKLALEAAKINEKKTVYQQLYDWLTLNYPRIELSDKKAVENPFIPILDRKFTQTNVGARLARIAIDKVYARPLPSGQVELVHESRVTNLDGILDSLEASFRAQPMTDRRVVEVGATAAPAPQGTRKVVDLFDPKHGFTVVVQTKTSTVESADPSTFDNIVIACQKINGTMVNPGEIFSFNRVVGERSVRAGFKQAAGSAVVGIGVGQVSSTMYEPLLRAGVKILERHRHSYWYPELKFSQYGLDAAVTDAGWDLRFLNDTPLPLLLMAYMKNAKLTFELRSIQEPPYRVDLHMGKVVKSPFRTEWRTSAKVAKGTQRVITPGIEGIKVRVYRTFLTREEGRKEREERISDDEYQARGAVIEVPPDFKPPPEPKPEPTPKPSPADEPAAPLPLPRATADEDEDEPPPRKRPDTTVEEEAEEADPEPRRRPADEEEEDE
jgi:vancomycin resistance protein YoaR